MSFFCSCNEKWNDYKDEMASLKRQIKEINEVLTTLEIKALEVKRQYAKKLKNLDKDIPVEETKDLYSSVLLPDNGNTSKS